MVVGQHGLVGVVALDTLVAQFAVGEAQLAVVEDLAGALMNFSSVKTQPAEAERNVPQRQSGAKREEPSRRTLPWT